MLKWIFEFKESAGRVTQCRLLLMKADFEEIHKPEESYMKRHALSRLPTTSAKDVNIDDKVPTYQINHRDGLETTRSNLFSTDWEQFRDVLTTVKRQKNDNKVLHVSTTDELFRKQKQDAFCSELAKEVESLGAVWNWWKRATIPIGPLRRRLAVSTTSVSATNHTV